MINFIRSTIFNIVFFGLTLVLCIAYLPLLVLPRQWYIDAVHFWLHIVAFLEKYIMGITYEVRGAEHLPEDGAYLIAAKHQSAYETFKLHLLFDDPAVILKKELLFIPLWGFHLAKADVIAIDRSTPEKALRSIEDGAKRVAAQGRPIVIFPQGTRVAPDVSAQDKPYKPGIARVQDITGLPVIPMAVNSGVFWPRNSYMKRPGKVIIEFLEPIPAGAMDRKTLMANLEMRIEDETSRIVEEGKAALEKRAKDTKILNRLMLGFLALVFALYTALWFVTANEVKTAYQTQMQNMLYEERDIADPKISGFPGKLTVTIADEYLQTDKSVLKVENLQAKSWPWPGLPISVTADSITLGNFEWPEHVVLTNLSADLTVVGELITILNSEIYKNDFKLGVAGSVDMAQRPVPKLDLNLELTNADALFTDLARMDFLDNGVSFYAKSALAMLEDDDGVVRVPLTQQGQTLYVGPLPVASLPERPQ